MGGKESIVEILVLRIDIMCTVNTAIYNFVLSSNFS